MEWFFESKVCIYKIISNLMVQRGCMKNYDSSVPEDILRLLKRGRVNIISDLKPFGN